MTNKIDEIEQLHRLMMRGVLTQQEFQSKKAEILAQPESPQLSPSNHPEAQKKSSDGSGGTFGSGLIKILRVIAIVAFVVTAVLLVLTKKVHRTIQDQELKQVAVTNSQPPGGSGNQIGVAANNLANSDAALSASSEKPRSPNSSAETADLSTPSRTGALQLSFDPADGPIPIRPEQEYKTIAEIKHIQPTDSRLCGSLYFNVYRLDKLGNIEMEAVDGPHQKIYHFSAEEADHGDISCAHSAGKDIPVLSVSAGNAYENWFRIDPDQLTISAIAYKDAKALGAAY